MKRTTAICISILALGAGSVPAFANLHAPQEHANAAHPAPAKLTLDQGGKWSTDEPLRRHMGELRADLAQHRDAILADKLTAAQTAALAQAIERRVAAIMTDCNREPRADANLHLVMAELVQAADILQGKYRLQRREGATRAVRAATMYATYFDHPGWESIY
jgi:hypothetical protein